MSIKFLIYKEEKETMDLLFYKTTNSEESLFYWSTTPFNMFIIASGAFQGSLFKTNLEKTGYRKHLCTV